VYLKFFSFELPPAAYGNLPAKESSVPTTCPVSYNTLETKVIAVKVEGLQNNSTLEIPG
jgi:hypothetical protein